MNSTTYHEELSAEELATLYNDYKAQKEAFAARHPWYAAGYESQDAYELALSDGEGPYEEVTAEEARRQEEAYYRGQVEMAQRECDRAEDGYYAALERLARSNAAPQDTEEARAEARRAARGVELCRALFHKTLADLSAAKRLFPDWKAEGFASEEDYNAAWAGGVDEEYEPTCRQEEQGAAHDREEYKEEEEDPFLKELWYEREQ